MKTRPWSELRQKMLRKSPICCANYLLTCAQDEERIFLKALGNIYEAWKDKLGSAETGGEKAAPAKNAAMEIWPRGAFESEEQFAVRVQRISAIISRHYQPMVAELAGLRKRGTVGEVYGFDCEETYGCPGTGEPTSPLRSQNPTVSSGVEGAHEGTTADKSELLPTQLPKDDL